MQQINLYNPYRTELYHAGIKGMKWGIRRFQNEDGSLTPEGRERYGVGQAEGRSSDTPATPAKPAYQRIIPKREKKSKFRDLSDEELKARIDRIKLEQQYIQTKNDVDEKSMGFVKKTLRDVGQKAVSSLANYVVGTAVNKLLGADVMQGVPKKAEKEDKEYKELKRKAEMAKFREEISKNTASVEDREKDRSKKAKEEAEKAKKEKEEASKKSKEEADKKAKDNAEKAQKQREVAEKKARYQELKKQAKQQKAQQKAEQRAQKQQAQKEARIRAAEQKARDRMATSYLNNPAYFGYQQYMSQMGGYGQQYLDRQRRRRRRNY